MVPESASVIAHPVGYSVLTRAPSSISSKQVEVIGISGDSQLRQIVDSHLHDIALPPDGLLLTRKLGEMLGVDTGDTVTLEVLEGAREGPGNCLIS